MLITLFFFTVIAGLAGAVWEWVGISRLLSRDHPETRHGTPYPALIRKISTTHRVSHRTLLVVVSHECRLSGVEVSPVNCRHWQGAATRFRYDAGTTA